MFRNADGVTSRSSSQVPRGSFAQIIFGFFLAALLGDTVKKGQLLLRVQSTDVATAFSDYQKAVADEQLTRTQLERAITMTVAGAIDLISHLVRFHPNILVGAGTILDLEVARKCVDAGAVFLTSPGFDPALIEFAAKKEIAVLAGALTPTEVISAWRAGSGFVKVFPCAQVGGDTYIKALKGPLPQVSLIAAGGVNQQTAANFILAGASAIGVGSELIPTEAIDRRQGGKNQRAGATLRQFREGCSRTAGSAKTQANLQEVGWSRKVRGEITSFRSLAAAFPDFNRFRSLDPVFFLTISLAFFLFSAILCLGKSCESKARQTFCRFFILGRSLRRFSKSFRMNRCAIPRFALFYRQFWTRNPFRLNTYEKSSEVLILNNLQRVLNFLESTLPGKGGRGWGARLSLAFLAFRTSPRFILELTCVLL